MRKIWVIACREYKVAVRSKAFIITIVLMPLLMSVSIAMQILFKNLEDTKEKHYAVIDRTRTGLARDLAAAAEKHNQKDIFDPETNKQIAPKIAISIIEPPADDNPETIAALRYELSQRVEKDEFEGIVEIGPKVFESRGNGQQAGKIEDDASIRFQAKKTTQQKFMRWAEQEINKAIIARRFVDKKADPQAIADLLQTAPLKYRALTKANAQGDFEDAKEEAQVANFLLPAVLIGLMFMVVMVGATPAMQGIVEEKSQRIAEVLLGSVTPFKLMAGKLLGVIGMSMTMAAVYLIGGYIVADRYGVAEMLTVGLLAWFLLFLVLALFIFGSLFIAVGAAAGDIKDTQLLLMPFMLIACLPFFALGPIIQDPNGKIAVACSFFPFAAPMMLVARQSVPPGVPLTQMIAGIVLILATALVCVWAAGRIFRIGILLQGKGARFADLFNWILKG